MPLKVTKKGMRKRKRDDCVNVTSKANVKEKEQANPVSFRSSVYFCFSGQSRASVVADYVPLAENVSPTPGYLMVYTRPMTSSRSATWPDPARSHRTRGSFIVTLLLRSSFVLVEQKKMFANSSSQRTWSRMAKKLLRCYE